MQVNTIIYYAVIAVSILSPIAFGIFLGSIQTAKLNGSLVSPTLQEGFIWSSQIVLLMTIFAVSYMVDAVIRIFQSVKSNRLHIVDESYMLFHIIFFSIYLVNLIVLDTMFLRSKVGNNVAPGKAFEITGCVIVITGFLS
jgi:hypothetical protein